MPSTRLGTRTAIIAAVLAITALTLMWGWQTQTASGTDERTIPAQDVAILGDGASDFQWDILADGVVGDGEYETAVRATRTCVEAGGIDGLVLTEPTWAGDQFTYQMSAPPLPDGSDPIAPVFTRCYEEYQKRVDTARAGIAPLPSADEARAHYRMLAACLQKRGVAIMNEPSFRDVVNATQAAGETGTSALLACTTTSPEGPSVRDEKGPR